MSPIDVCRKVVAEHQCHVVRQRAPNEYDAKPYGTIGSGSGVLVDAFSASAVVKVYDALNAENKVRFSSLSLVKMVKIAFQMCS